MKIGVSFVTVLLLSFILTPQVHAIILLPALVLIPIAKIIAVVFAGLAIPSLGLSLITHKLFKTPLKKVGVTALLLLVLVCVLVAVLLKIIDPSRPLL